MDVLGAFEILTLVAAFFLNPFFCLLWSFKGVFPDLLRRSSSEPYTSTVEW